MLGDERTDMPQSGRLALMSMSGRTQGDDVTTWSTLAAGPPDA